MANGVASVSNSSGGYSLDGSSSNLSSYITCNCFNIFPNPDYNGENVQPLGNINFTATTNTTTTAQGLGKWTFNREAPIARASVTWNLQVGDSQFFGQELEVTNYDALGQKINYTTTSGLSVYGTISIPILFTIGTSYDFQLSANATTASIFGPVINNSSMNLYAQSQLSLQLDSQLFSFPEDADGDPAYKAYYCSEGSPPGFTPFLGEINLPTIPGDFDYDGDVDGRDFLIWQRGESANPFSAGDLEDWQTNYGTGLLSTVTAVPEPSTAIVAVLALSLLIYRADT
jgi:hypothetical protein